MTMKNQNFEMYAGDTKSVVVTVTNPDSTPVNLTGASVSFVLKRGSTTVTKTTGAGITITNALNGEFTVTLQPSDTQTLGGDYQTQATVTDSGGVVSTVLVGKVTINQS